MTGKREEEERQEHEEDKAEGGRVGSALHKPRLVSAQKPQGPQCWGPPLGRLGSGAWRGGGMTRLASR